MKTWYAKQLSQLANVSVRTLHYYDKIALLKPSIRQENNYRLYSEKDLLKLQQIVALKFFGFELAQIKKILADNQDVVENFAMQAKFLKQKAQALMQASNILNRITDGCSQDKSIPWNNIIELIEVYQMTEQLEHSWVKEIFNQQELKEYAEFEAQMKSKSGPEGKARFEKQWRALVEEIKANLNQDPQSKIGIELGGRCFELINALYGKKYAHLRTKKFEKGFGEGKGLEDIGFTQEINAWYEKAVVAYLYDRAYVLLAQIDELPEDEMLQQWNEYMDELYGLDEARKRAAIELALNDDNISNKAKQWLKTL